MKKQHDQNPDFLLFVFFFWHGMMGRPELRPDKCTVCCFCPVWMRTEMARHLSYNDAISNAIPHLLGTWSFDEALTAVTASDLIRLPSLRRNLLQPYSVPRQQSDPKRGRLSTKLHAGKSQMTTTASSLTCLQIRHWTLPWTKWSPHPHTLFHRH